MASAPWYSFYPKDYRDKTSGLTMAQDGAYRRLMDEYYITGKPLSANADVLLRVCRAFDEAERVAVTFVLDEYFTLMDDGWHHDDAHKCASRPPGPVRSSSCFNRRRPTGWEPKRQAVFQRDGRVCQYCLAPTARPECDHIVPVSRGGSDDARNLATACKPCNASKKDKLLSEWRGKK